MSQWRSVRVLSILAMTAALGSAQPPAVKSVIIQTAKPYSRLVAAIQARGGKVTRQYQYVGAVAAQIPASALAEIRAVPGVVSMSKDLVVEAPRSVDVARGKQIGPAAPAEAVFDSAQALTAAGIRQMAGANPAAYVINNAEMGLGPLHAGGKLGGGVIVAVIDSGIRPGFPHIDVDGSVIGGEDFVGDGLGFSNFANGGHGTFVAGMISANVVLGFSTASALVQALNAYVPGAAIPFSSTASLVPIVGSAPLASIYALRVFPPTGGAPSSRIMAAVERAIELRERYDAGQPGGVNIRVCNMSLGGATVAPGMDVYDQLIEVLLSKDIVPVISSGNAGPATLTTGSPGTSRGAITVGAANLARNERVLRDLQYGPGIGAFYRPSAATQVAYFSSRGPNADGRTDPDVVSNGFASFGMGLGATATSVSVGSGTSFSTPSVAGVAAVLREAFPAATARQVRNAILMAADAGKIGAAGPVDQGRGYVNAQGAYSLLAAGLAPDSLEPPPHSNRNVKVNIEQNTALSVQDGFVRQAMAGLKPGERRDILYRVNPNTSQVIISLSGFTAALPAAHQNALFGDDLLVAVHTAKTSAIGEGDYPEFEFMRNGTLVVNKPETGILRVSVNGDWTNAGAVSTEVAILSLKNPVPQFTAQGKIAHSETVLRPFTVPVGTQKLEVQLAWREDWGTYPSADMDLILIDPSNAMNLDGAFVNNPENATVTDPKPGQWVALVDAFEVPSGGDKYELRIALDGKVVK